MRLLRLFGFGAASIWVLVNVVSWCSVALCIHSICVPVSQLVCVSCIRLCVCVCPAEYVCVSLLSLHQSIDLPLSRCLSGRSVALSLLKSFGPRNKHVARTANGGVVSY